MEDLFDSSSFTAWNEETCASVAKIERHEAPLPSDEDLQIPSAETQYSPAILFMEATEEMLASEGVELWNDTRIDIYRNIELHDEDEDSVVQTTTQKPDNPVEELISKLPKTGDTPIGLAAIVVALMALAIGALTLGTKGMHYKRR